MNSFLRRPAINEHANGHEERRCKARQECVFRRSKPVLGDTRGRVPFDPGHVDEGTYAKTDGCRKKNDAEFAEVEVVDVDIDEGKGFEEGVEEGVHECCVDGCEGDGGVEKVELEGPVERVDGHGVEAQVALVDLALRHEFRGGVGVGEAEAAGAVEQDGARIRFWH